MTGWRWFLLETCPSDLSFPENYQRNTHKHILLKPTDAPVRARAHTTLYNNSHPLLKSKTRFSSFVLEQWHLYGGRFVLLPPHTHNMSFSPTPYILYNLLQEHIVRWPLHMISPQTDTILWLTTWRHYIILYVNFQCNPFNYWNCICTTYDNNNIIELVLIDEHARIVNVCEEKPFDAEINVRSCVYICITGENVISLIQSWLDFTVYPVLRTDVLNSK